MIDNQIDIKDKEIYKIITDTMESVKETDIDRERLIIDCADKLSLEVSIVKEVLEYHSKLNKGK